MLDNRDLRIGIDSGGTFTDICIFDGSTGKLFVWKVSSTPSDPSDGILAGFAEAIEAFRAAGGSSAPVGQFAHGTTVATNAVIEGRGARVGLITTQGFRDLLEIKRQQRPFLYDLQKDLAAPLIRRDLRLEVPERVAFDGTVDVPLDEDAVRAAVRRLRGRGIEAVAVCFLFSFALPQHEDRVRQIIFEEAPDWFVSLSHEVSPKAGEYERLSTAAMNSFVGPIMDAYLGKLVPRLRTAGVEVTPLVTQSNGGIVSVDTARKLPVCTLLSGPAAGVMGAIALTRAAGIPNAITFDMGGTSTDVALIENGVPKTVAGQVIHGHPLHLTALDIHTVGAGGGSIAHIDTGTLLKVGPRSAGAFPGPVCYGNGNIEPTVTDANVVLRVLNPQDLLSGRMKIDAKAAQDAIARIAGDLAMEPLDVAQGVISIVIANMVRAIRVISIERGHDPRDFTLIAFGGAGPIHATRLARALEIPRVLIPRNPGAMCAVGLLLTDMRFNTSLTRIMGLEAGVETALAEGFANLDRRALDWFLTEGIEPADRLLARSVDMRYKGQGYDIQIAYPEGGTEDVASELRRRFEKAHEKLYGYVAPADEPLQIRNLNIEATAKARGTVLSPSPAVSTPVHGAVVGRRSVFLQEEGDFAELPIYARDLLGNGHVVDGPAIVEQMDSTILILPGQEAVVDAYLNLLIHDTSSSN